jgi:hypothetical protein
MKPILDPRIAMCAEAGGRMVACLVAIPDLNQALNGTNGRLFPTGPDPAAVAQAATSTRREYCCWGSTRNIVARLRCFHS